MGGSISLHQHIFNAAVSGCYKVYKFSGAPLTHIFAKQQKYALNEIVRLIYVPGVKQSAGGKDSRAGGRFVIRNA